MRVIVLAFAILCTAYSATAQERAERPDLPAPPATAAFEQREDWCQKYAAWFVERAPSMEAPSPTDVRPTQRFENELSYCKLDPQEYERQTIAELARETQGS
jgi:hypothetical protein